MLGYRDGCLAARSVRILTAMTGFLSPYSGESTVDMGGGYWVRVKKFLSVEESEAAENAFTAGTQVVMGADGTPTVTFDRTKQLFEQVLVAIAAWNLTDENDQPLPLDHSPELERTSGRPSPRRRSLRLLPQVAFDKISFEVGRNNNNDPESDARFRGGSEVVPALGEVEASDDREVHPGTEVVDAVGGGDGSVPDRPAPDTGSGGVSDVDADDGGGSGETEAAAEVPAAEAMTV